MRRDVDLEAVTREAEQRWEADGSVRAEFDYRREDYLAFRRAEARGLVGIHGSANAVEPALAVVDLEAAHREAEQQWESSAALRDEFNGWRDAWIAYARAEARGEGKIHGRTNAVVGGAIEPAQTPAGIAHPNAGGGAADRLAPFRRYAQGLDDEVPGMHAWYALSADESPIARELVRQRWYSHLGA